MTLDEYREGHILLLLLHGPGSGAESVMLASQCLKVDSQWTTKYEILKFLFLDYLQLFVFVFIYLYL